MSGASKLSGAWLAAVIVCSASALAEELERRDFVIFGKCRDGDDMSPLSGVQMRLFVVRGLVAAPEEIAQTVSSPQGDFEFTGLERPNPEGHLDRLGYGIVAELDDRPIEVVDEWHARLERQMRGDRKLPLDRSEIRIAMSRQAGSLTGRVTDATGSPVKGALVFRSGLHGYAIPGVHSELTDAEGSYVLKRLPVVRPRADFREQVWISIVHPDYLPANGKGPMIPGQIDAVLAAGHRLAGLVRNEADGNLAAGIVVTACEVESSDCHYSQTDASGRYQIVVPQGTYQIRAEAQDLVSVALTDIEVPAAVQGDLPTVTMVRGGLMTGQVRDSRTGQPVSVTDDGNPIAIGLIGPSHPMGRVISPLRLALVDAEGRFSLRAAPGENFPYFVLLTFDFFFVREDFTPPGC